MDNLILWVIAFTVVPTIVISKYIQLRNASRDKNCSIRQYLSSDYQMWSIISEALIYLGLVAFVLIVVSRFETINSPYFSRIQIFPVVLVVLGVAILIINNISKFKPGELKRQFLSEYQLEKKVSNSRKALLFLLSAPIFIGLSILIEFAFPYDDGKFIGFDISKISLWKLAIIVLLWTTIYSLMVSCAYYLRKMAKQMLTGNLYGKEPIKHLSISSNLLQVMAMLLMLYSFSEGLLTGNISVSFLLKPIFWLSYFLVFLSLMLKYLSHILQRAAILKEENDLTV